MKINGLHFLIAYKCNLQCSHCFLSCGAERNGKIELDDAKKIIDDAKEISSISYIDLEGGEPFLYPVLIEDIISHAIKNDYPVSILSNGFWAQTVEKGIKALQPLKEAGLQEIGISTDEYHQKKLSIKSAKSAVEAARKIGMKAYLMEACKNDIVCRGRGANICAGKPVPWQSLTRCPENLGNPSRVHIGPEGSIHLCQALLIGKDYRKESLKNILEGHLRNPNVIVKQLLSGGPAKLAYFAKDYGFQPNETYVQSCQLCFDARKHIYNDFPDILSPKENYRF